MAEGECDSVDNLAEVFNKTCNIGVSGTQPRRNAIPVTPLNKWLKGNGIFGKTLTSTDSDIAFNKCKNAKNQMPYDKFVKEFLPILAVKYKVDKKLANEEEAIKHMKAKLTKEVDLTKGTTKQSKTGGVDKMTDASQYTGSHKERFDAEGKGKGKEGRTDTADTSGYVGAYKGEGTYDKK